MKELLNIMEQLAGSVLPKNVLGIFLMLRLVHVLGSCRTDTFTSMSNGKQKFLHNADNPFMLHHSKQGIHMGIYSGKTPQPEDQAPLLGCAFNVGNFW